MAKRKQLSTKDLPPKSKGRFNFDLDEEDFEDFKLGYVPPNTALDTQKCMKLFSDWASTRNAHFPGNPVLDNILSSTDKTHVCEWVCKFASEARKKDREPYPPKTIHHYIMGIQRHIRQTTKSSVNLLTDPEFLQLQNLLDALYCKLHAAGISTTIKKTPVLTSEDENQLWALKVLYPETPQGLLRTIFFLNGKIFCLRGGSEHQDLKLSQFHREVVGINGKHVVHYTYMEYVDKNHVGGLKQIRQENKVVHQYESEDVNCHHVLLLDKYISKLSPEAKAKDIFYMKPKTTMPKDTTSPWYTAVPLGRNTLAEMKKMLEKAELATKYTNHSLRAYGVTRLFQSNVPDKLIMERSGHRSTEGLREYQRTDVLQELQVCKALDSALKGKSLCNQVATVQPPLAAQSIPGFSGCTFNNCMFQFASLPAISQATDATVPYHDDLTGIDPAELFDF